jgi:hypothetical protein
MSGALGGLVITRLHFDPKVGAERSRVMAILSRFRLSRVVVAAALVAGFAAPVALASSAQAQGWHGGYGGYGGWHGGYGGYYGPGPGVAIASGLLGLAVGAAVGSALAPPVYAAPPPVYYAAPPVIYAAPPPVYYAPPPPPPPAYYPPQN